MRAGPEVQKAKPGQECNGCTFGGSRTADRGDLRQPAGPAMLRAWPALKISTRGRAVRRPMETGPRTAWSQVPRRQETHKELPCRESTMQASSS